MKENPTYRLATDQEIFDAFCRTDNARRRLAFYLDNQVTFHGCGCCSDESRVIDCQVCGDPCFPDENYVYLCDNCKNKGYYEDEVDYKIKQKHPVAVLVEEVEREELDADLARIIAEEEEIERRYRGNVRD